MKELMRRIHERIKAYGDLIELLKGLEPLEREAFVEVLEERHMALSELMDEYERKYGNDTELQEAHDMFKAIVG